MSPFHWSGPGVLILEVDLLPDAIKDHPVAIEYIEQSGGVIVRQLGSLWNFSVPNEQDLGL